MTRSTPASSASAPGPPSPRETATGGWPSSPTTPSCRTPSGLRPSTPRARVTTGADAIAAFYDTVIASSEAITFEITESYLCGDEVADVGTIRTTLAGGTHQAVVRGVYTYRSNGAGKLASLRAFWEFDALELVELED